jgi:hypothetical protein
MKKRRKTLVCVFELPLAWQSLKPGFISIHPSIHPSIQLSAPTKSSPVANQQISKSSVWTPFQHLS